MPSLVAVLFHPTQDRPKPREVNAIRVIGIGSMIWIILIVVTGVMYLSGAATASSLAACITGLALGGLWWLYEKLRIRFTTQRGQIKAPQQSPESEPRNT